MLKTPLLLIYVISILSLSSCEGVFTLPDKKRFSQETKIVKHQKIRSEKLLEADGHWHIVEKSQSYDPAKAHLKARENVNVARNTNKGLPPSHFKPNAKNGHDGKLRVLRLEPQDNMPKGSFPDHKLVDSSVVKPSSMVVGKKILKEVATFLASDKTVIKPPPLPDRKIKVSNVASNLAGDIIIPKIKPAIKNTNMGTNKPSSSLNTVIIPKIKPKIMAKSFDKIKSVSSVSKLFTKVNSGNIRIVIEVSHTTKYKVTIDDLRNVFRVKMENTSWDIAPKGHLRDNDLLGTYIASEQEGDNILLEIRLKKKTKIAKTMVLKPNKTIGNRIVIDLQEQ